MRGSAHCIVNPLLPNFLLTHSFDSPKTFPHFAGNYSVSAHNEIVIEITSSANVRLAHANPATPLTPLRRGIYGYSQFMQEFSAAPISNAMISDNLPKEVG